MTVEHTLRNQPRYATLVSDTTNETKHGPSDDDINLVCCLKVHSVVTWVAMIRWTQWIFIQLFNKGLAYQAEVPVNWCPALGTVLANEEIIDGKSERGDHPVERMPMKQVGTLHPVSSYLTVCKLFIHLVLMYYYCRSVSPCGQDPCFETAEPDSICISYPSGL